ncbi:MAG: flavin reductase [Proteobacteria bacterium]|nr:flavin reductase [Pseudomonadota bacterium]
MTPNVTQTEFRNAMARVCAPVNVITTKGEAGRGGFTATAMCAVTDAPPTLLVCMNSRSAQTDLFIANKRFCVNVLTQEHKELAASFAGGLSDMDARYAAAAWVDLPSGNQALADAIVSFDCRLADVRMVGTHNIFIADVVHVRSRPDGHALLYFDRNYVHVPGQTGSFGG